MGTAGTLSSAAAGTENVGNRMPRAMSMRSATTAEAVGSAPAPRPSCTVPPVRSPSPTTPFNTPSTAAIGASRGTMQG